MSSNLTDKLTITSSVNDKIQFEVFKNNEKVPSLVISDDSEQVDFLKLQKMLEQRADALFELKETDERFI